MPKIEGRSLSAPPKLKVFGSTQAALGLSRSNLTLPKSGITRIIGKVSCLNVYFVWKHHVSDFLVYTILYDSIMCLIKIMRWYLVMNGVSNLILDKRNCREKCVEKMKKEKVSFLTKENIGGIWVMEDNGHFIFEILSSSFSSDNMLI